MADIVLIDLRASYSQFTTATRQAAGELGKVSTSGKKAGSDVTKSFNQADQSVNHLNTDLSKVDNHLKTAGASAKKAGTSFNAMGAGLLSIGATMGLGLGLQTFISQAHESIEAASNLNETISKTGELFGQSTDAVINWSTTASTSFGQSQQQALDAASTFAIFGRAAGLSGSKLVDFTTDFTELASDLASFNNTSPEEAINAIGAALRGEAEPIRRYGVLLDEATIEQEAIALGIIKTTKEALTPQQKVLAVQAAIYKQTAAAQGDFARTADGLANSQRSLNAQFKDLQATAGTKLLPVMLDLVAGLNLLMQGDFSQGISRLTDVAELGLPVIQEVREAYQAFAEGNFWKGLQNVGETALSAVTLGFSTRVKNFFTPSAESMIKELSAFEKAALLAAQMTDDELNKSLDDLAKFSGRSREEFAKMAEDIRKQAIHETFLELSKALEITTEQYKRLTDISDKYGISARINSSLILDIKQSTEEDLNVAFNKFNATLGVTSKDFRDYIGIVQGIPPKHDDLGKSTAKLVGPYDRLTKSVNDSMKALQDQVTLFSQSKGTWEDALLLAQKYADNQNALVEVNKLVEDSLKRTVRNGLLPLIEANQFVMVSQNQLIERFKFTDEQIKERDDLFKSLGVNQISTYEQTLDRIYELQHDEIRASDQTLSAIAAITEKYSKAITVVQLQQTEATLNAMGDLAGALSTTLSSIFGDAAKKNATFASFIQTLTIAEILFKQGAAIANAIEKLTTFENPFQLIAGIASLITAVGGVFSGIISTMQSTPIPEPPTFFDGTPYLQLGSNPKGKDTIPLLGHEGEAIIPADDNAAYPGLSKAWIDGGLDKYIIDRWVTPALIKQEKEIKNDFAKNIANSLLLQSGIFNDKNIINILKQNRDITGQGFVELIDAVKQKPKKRGNYA